MRKATIEIMANDKKTKGNTLEKAAGTGKALEVPVVEKAQTSRTNPKPVVQSNVDDQLGHKPPTGYTNRTRKSMR